MGERRQKKGGGGRGDLVGTEMRIRDSKKSTERKMRVGMDQNIMQMKVMTGGYCDTMVNNKAMDKRRTPMS